MTDSTSTTTSILTTDFSAHLALITGATGGIGSATAKSLASHGCSIAVHYNADVTTAESLVASLTSQYNVRAQSFQADLSSYDATRKLHADVVAAMGHPTILFNNAGSTMGIQGIKNIEEVDAEVFEKTWRVNCGTGFELTRLCVPEMERRGWGRVIFCSSVAGFTGGGVGPHYASSKSALHGLIHWLATAYAKKGITFNGVAPALIEDTKMVTGAKFVEEMRARIPVGRLGRSEEVAELVLYLAKSGYMTNKVVGIDGGMFIQ